MGARSGARAGTYGGLTAAQRRAERRARLVEAAAGIWDDDGWAAVSMRAVCARAGLIDRYFYESFADRDAVLVAVWEHERTRVVRMVQEAARSQPADDIVAQLRAAAGAVVAHAAAHPRRARMVLGDNAGCPPLENARGAALQTFTDVLVQLVHPHVAPPGVEYDERGFRMTTLVGIGGFVELVLAWQRGLVEATAAELVEHAAEVGAALIGCHRAPVDAPAAGRPELPDRA